MGKRRLHFHQADCKDRFEVILQMFVMAQQVISGIFWQQLQIKLAYFLFLFSDAEIYPNMHPG